MSEIDGRIPLMGRFPNIESPNDWIMGAQSIRKNNMLLGEADRKIASRNMLSGLVRQNTNAQGQPNYGPVNAGMAQAGYGDQLPEMQGDQADTQKKQLEAQLQLGSFVAQKLQPFVGAEPTPEVAQRYGQTLSEIEGIVGREITALPRHYEPRAVMSAYQTGMAKLKAAKDNWVAISGTEGYSMMNKANSQIIPAIDPVSGQRMMAPNTSPELAREMELSRQGPKGVTVKDSQNREIRTTQERANPEAFGQVAYDTIKNGITPVESGGQPNPARATNPDSSAYGATQVTDATQRDSGFPMLPFPKNGTKEEQQAWSAVQYQYYLERFNGDERKATQAWRDGVRAVEEGRPDTTGYVDKVNQNMRRRSGDGVIRGPSMQELSQNKINEQDQLNKQKLEAETAQKQKQSDIDVIKNEPVQREAFKNQLLNLQEYKARLDKLNKQVGGNPLLDNNPVYNTRAALGTDENIANIESMSKNFIQDQIKAMQAIGLSPAQMMNTEIEAKRFVESVTGNGNSSAKLEAFARYERQIKSNLKEYEEQRKSVAKRNGVEYKPLDVQPPTQKPTIKFLGFE